jgi:hypothetical protein
MLLTRESLLAKEELKIEKVELPDGDFVFVRMMTGRERDLFERSLLREVVDKKGNTTYKQSLEDFRAKMVVNVVCDELGKNLLQPNDYNLLSQNMSAAKLELIVNAAQALNKISETDKEALIKNSEADQSASATIESVEIVDTPIPTSGSEN